MVSGDIYAVLGVAMRQAGNAVPISYLLAGIITLVTGYLYVKLSYISARKAASSPLSNTSPKTTTSPGSSDEYSSPATSVSW